jgi:hypothetical protein
MLTILPDYCGVTLESFRYHILLLMLKNVAVDQRKPFRIIRIYRIAYMCLTVSVNKIALVLYSNELARVHRVLV